ncbi:hypothetical protein C1645_827607 [Glomus cerebriforme]|uniref:Uncharacterized protein n=1 Tax=Glomus cerebriforme TaxID=658196 RepID=A0A397SU73_9GLOM|nr:hypothetical protein C1645_827607 [Glomus cerebriforme]
MTNKMIRLLRHGSGDQAEESGSQDPEESDDDFQPVKPKKQLSLSKKNKESVVVTLKKVKITSRNDRVEGSTSSDLSRSESAESSEVRSPEYNRPHTPPHQIVRNIYNQEILINENILIMSAKNLASIDESKWVCKIFVNRSIHKIAIKKPSREVKLPEDWRNIIEEYYKEATESRSKKSISDWIHTTKELNVVKKDDTDMSSMASLQTPIIIIIKKSFAKLIPDINASDTSEHHYCMEVPVLASKYRKNYGYDHAIDKVIDGKHADLLARIWRTGEEVFVRKQAGSPSQPEPTKLAMDSFKLILEYLYEIKMFIMWKDGVYMFEEFESLNIASIPDQISLMKSDMLKLLEFMIIIKNEAENTVTRKYNSDTIQILKRKFNELVQTKKSPTKVLKVKKCSGDFSLI